MGIASAHRFWDIQEQSGYPWLIEEEKINRNTIDQ
jgi:hypothetical protein